MNASDINVGTKGGEEMVYKFNKENFNKNVCRSFKVFTLNSSQFKNIVK